VLEPGDFVLFVSFLTDSLVVVVAEMAISIENLEEQEQRSQGELMDLMVMGDEVHSCGSLQTTKRNH
jgi:hypothetical protein